VRLQADEITRRRFSRRLFGAHPDEVRRYLSEVAAVFSRTLNDLAVTETQRVTLETQRATLEKALRDATARNVELGKQLAAAEAVPLAAQERLGAIQDELVRTQEKLVAQLERDGQIAHMLLDAQRLSEQIVEGGRAKAEETVAAAQAEAGRIVQDARETAAEAVGGAERQVAALGARVAEVLAIRGEVGRDIEAIRARHDASLETLAKILVDAEQRVLPMLNHLQRALSGEATEQGGPPAPSPETPVMIAPQAVVSAPDLPRGAVPGNGAAHRPGTEIVVGPFESFLEATKLLATLSQMKDMRNARLRPLPRDPHE